VSRPRLVFVEANTTGTGMLALRTATRLGTEPVLLTGRRDRYAGLAETGARVVECDTNDPAALRRAVDALAGEPGGLAGIATTSEFYLVPVAELAAERGLPGNPPAATATCRDKSRTRAALSAAGVGQPRYAAVRDPAEVPAAVDRVGLPCVVKPADDSGSNAVLRCDDVAAARAQAAAVLAVTTNVRGQPTAGTALVEEYLAGPEVSVETFSVDGRVSCVGVTAKGVTGGPHFVEHQHVFPAELPAAVTAQAEETTARALAATGFALGACHVEVKLTGAGPAVVEINARLAGGMIPELVALATGVDLLEQQLRAFAGLPVRLAPARSRRAGIRFLLPPAAGHLRAVAGTDAAREVPGVDRVVVTAAPGREVRPPRNAYDRLGYVIAAGDSAAEVERTLRAATDLIRVEVDP
jgi:cysteine synthase A